MADKAYAFGSSVKRFKTLGLHPNLIHINTKTPLGPGQYNPQQVKCTYKSKIGSWKTKLESEEFSKYLGFKNPQVLCDRFFAQSLGGPGTYDFPDPPKGASVFKNVGFNCEKRFHNPFKDETLPPGTHTVKTPKTKFTTTPTFEWDNFASRLKTTEPPYKQAPNRYNLPHYCVTDKVVSKRGPYDTFTGPRDQTTIKNHFAPPLFKAPDTVYEMPSDLDKLLHHSSKKRCGKFLLSERFPAGMSVVTTKNGFAMFQKDNKTPGPADYDVSMGIKAAKANFHPFNCSKASARPPPNWKIHPGPDRYKIKYPKCHMKKTRKQSWMFLSRAGRDMVQVESYSNFLY